MPFHIAGRGGIEALNSIFARLFLGLAVCLFASDGFAQYGSPCPTQWSIYMDQFYGQMLSLAPKDGRVPPSFIDPDDSRPVTTKPFSIFSADSNRPLKIYENNRDPRFPQLQLGYEGDPSLGYEGNPFSILAIFIGKPNVGPKSFDQQVARFSPPISDPLRSSSDPTSSWVTFKDLHFTPAPYTGFEEGIADIPTNSDKCFCPIILICAEGEFCQQLSEEHVGRIISRSIEMEAEEAERGIPRVGRRRNRQRLRAFPRQPKTPEILPPKNEDQAPRPSMAAPLPERPIALPARPEPPAAQTATINVRIYILKDEQGKPTHPLTDLDGLQVGAGKDCPAALQQKFQQTNNGNARLEFKIGAGKPPKEICIAVRRNETEIKCLIMPFSHGPYSIRFPDFSKSDEDRCHRSDQG